MRRVAQLFLKGRDKRRLAHLLPEFCSFYLHGPDVFHSLRAAGWRAAGYPWRVSTVNDSVSDAPFLLLSSRAEDPLAADEHECVARFAELPLEAVHQVRMEAGPLPEIDLGAYAGVILGGSPFTSITPKKEKSEVQRRVEKELEGLFARVRDERTPFLGLCYGVGTFGRFMGGTVDGQFSEPAGAIGLRVTAAGREDPLLADVPEVFNGLVGHKEALSALPDRAVLLVAGRACPFQMVRLADNQYVTQFHSEMDAEALARRMDYYRGEGYFGDDEFDAIVGEARRTDISGSHLVLRNFARATREVYAARRAS